MLVMAQERKCCLTGLVEGGDACGVDASSRPVEPAEVVRAVLAALASGGDLDAVHEAVRPIFLGPARVPARALLELAADAFVAARATRSAPLELEGLARRLLPEWPARGNTAQQKRRYALTAAVLIAAGAEPEDNSWWRDDDLWVHALDAVVVLVRAAAERRHVGVSEICGELMSGD